jgi:hypothetical protein
MSLVQLSHYDLSLDIKEALKLFLHLWESHFILSLLMGFEHLLKLLCDLISNTTNCALYSRLLSRICFRC